MRMNYRKEWKTGESEKQGRVKYRGRLKDRGEWKTGEIERQEGV